MLGEAIKDEVVWDCTTCRACMRACLVYIEHVPKLMDMRRNLAEILLLAIEGERPGK